MTKAVVVAQSHDATGTDAEALPLRQGLPPAPFLPVANRTLLGHALGWLAQAGVRQTAVIVPQQLAEPALRAAADHGHTPSLTWVEQRPGEGVAQALQDLTDFLDGAPFVLHLADSVAREALPTLITGGGGDEVEAALVVDDSQAAALDDVVELAPARGTGRTGRSTMRHASAGVAVLSARALEDAVGLDAAPGQLLEALVERVQERGGRVRTCGVSQWWRFRGGSDALLEGNRFALESQEADYRRAQLVNATIQGAVIAHPEARIESSVVRGPAIIGARAHLQDAYIGPYTSIGQDVIVENAEVENSVILAAASIRNLGRRLEGSVVGSRARMFRDFRLPRALRVNVGQEAEIAIG